MRRAVAVVSFLIVSAGRAAESPSLTLVNAVEHALAASPAAAAARHQAGAAAAGVREARSARLPSLSIAGSATQYSDPMVATPIHAFSATSLPPFDRTLTQAALSGSWTLFDAGARSARTAETEAFATAANAAADLMRQQVGFRTAVAYAAVLSRAAVLEAQDSRLRALESERDRVAQFERVGRAAHVEILRVEAALAAAEAERIDAAAALDEEERTLARLTELPVEDCRAARLQPFDANDLAAPPRADLERRIADAPGSRQARAQWLASQATVAFARSGNRPQVIGTASDLLFGNERALLENDWNAGVALRLSLFDGGATAARVARARAASAAAEAQLKATELESSIAIDRGLSELTQTRAAVVSLGKAVERYSEVARIEKLRLDNGAGTQTDYLRAEADLVASRATLAAAQYRTAVALLDLARTTGQLEPQWLASTFRSNR